MYVCVVYVYTWCGRMCVSGVYVCNVYSIREYMYAYVHTCVRGTCVRLSVRANLLDQIYA